MVSLPKLPLTLPRWLIISVAIDKVNHLGNFDPVLRSIRMFLHRRRRILPNSVGPANDSGSYSQCRHDYLPRESSLAI